MKQTIILLYAGLTSGVFGFVCAPVLQSMFPRCCETACPRTKSLSTCLAACNLWCPPDDDLSHKKCVIACNTFIPPTTVEPINGGQNAS